MSPAQGGIARKILLLISILVAALNIELNLGDRGGLIGPAAKRRFEPPEAVLGGGERWICDVAMWLVHWQVSYVE